MSDASKSASPLAVGEKVFVRTITSYFLGRVEEVLTAEGGHPAPGFLLSDCSWVASTGRFGDFLKRGTHKDFETEPYMDGVVFVAAGVIVDAARWPHELPRVEK